ncbi:hypothetical protein ACO0LG_23980 [Undibacterium sp. Ji42W]|uniref:hypothetical protein n=1 Tax=Undibacterium sp. Ji42W TaxID=3413039 RepID=UPI003BEF4EAF
MLVFTTTCWAESLTLAGKIGTSPVVMQLELNKGDVQGRYFYRRHHLDLALEGQLRDDGSLALTEVSAHSSTANAEMVVRPGPNGTWQGSWKAHARPATLRVQLSPLKTVTSSVTGPNAYEHERLQGLPLLRDNAETVADKKLQWWVEPVSGVRAFRFDSGYDATVLASLNARLSQEQTTAITAFFACQFDYSRRYGPAQIADFSFSAEPRLLTTTLISVRFSTVSTCNSGGLSIHGSSMNVQIPGMHELGLSQLIWGGDKPVVADESALSSWITNAMQNLHGNDMADLKERCAAKDQDIWRQPAWSMTAAGVMLEPAFSHNKQGPCGGEWLLPWTMFKLKPGR